MKSPNVYFRDTGLLHTLLGIRTEQELLQHPRSGASWEGFVLTPSMRAVIQDLELSRIVVIYPGSKPYPLAENIQVVPLASLAGDWTRILE